MVDRLDFLGALASEWWRGDGTQDAFDVVLEITNDHRERLPGLIAALAAAASIDALPYIGTTIVEDLAMQVEDGELSGPAALRLVTESGLPPSQLFLVLSGASAKYLLLLDGLSGAPISPVQTAWLLDDGAPHRWERSGQTFRDRDGIRFVPGRTPWQAELARRASRES